MNWAYLLLFLIPEVLIQEKDLAMGRLFLGVSNSLN